MFADTRAKNAARRWKLFLLLFALIGLGANGGTLRSLERIADSLRSSARQLETASEKTAEELSAVLHSDTSLASVVLLNQLEQVQARAGLTAGFIDSQIDKLKSEEIAGRNSATGGLAKPEETAANYRYWSASRGSDKSAGLILKDSLDGFVAWANGLRQEIENAAADENVKLGFDGFQSIAEDAGAEDAACETWVQRTFQGATAAADLVLLEKWKYDVRSIENQLIASIGRRAAQAGERQLMAVVAPKSQTVLVGQDFEAVVYLALAPDTKGNAPKPVFSGEGVQATAGGTSATIKIPAKPESLRKKDNIQSYSGVVKVPKANGTFEELPFGGTFLVNRPSVEIYNKKYVLNSIYTLCANEVIVDFPELGDSFRPAHTAEGGEVILNERSPSSVLLVPKEEKFKLNVKSLVNEDSIDIAEQNFKVYDLSYPDTYLFVKLKDWNRWKEWESSRTVSPSASIRIVARADKYHASILPKDTRYVIEGLKIYIREKDVLRRSIYTDIKSRMSKKGEAIIELDLSRIEGVGPGTSVLIVIDKMYRINFRDEKIEQAEACCKQNFVLINVE